MSKRKYGNYYDDDLYGEYCGYRSYYGCNSYSGSCNCSTIYSKKVELTDSQKEQLEKYKKANLERNFDLVNTYEEAIAKGKETGKGIYFFGKEGIYLYKILKIGGNSMETVDKVTSCGMLKEVPEGLHGFEITNRIPKDIVVEVLGSFHKVYEKNGYEAAAQVYRKPDGTYFIYYPEQTISKASVSYPDDKKIAELRTQNELVLEIHSHNSMSAFWSGTDDANEQEPCMYIVFGTLQADCATYKARVKYKTYQKELNLCDIFAITKEEEIEILLASNRSKGNEEILNKIKTYEVKTTPTWKYTYPNYSSVHTSETDPHNPYASKYYEKVDTCIQLSDDYYTNETIAYIDKLAKTFNYNSLPNSIAINYLEATKINKINNLKDKNTKFVDGESLPNSTSSNYSTNLEAQVNAKMLAFYGICSYEKGNGLSTSDNFNLFTEEGYKNAVKNILDTDAFSFNYSLPIIWESFNFYEKSLLAHAFYTSVTELGNFFYEKETCNYYFAAFLYMYIISCKEMREELQKYIDSCTTYITVYSTKDSDYDTYGDIASVYEVFDYVFEMQIDNMEDTIGSAVTIPMRITEVINDYDFSYVINYTESAKGNINNEFSSPEELDLFKGVV